MIAVVWRGKGGERRRRDRVTTGIEGLPRITRLR